MEIVWYILGGVVIFIVAAAIGIWYGSRSIGKGFEKTEAEREEFRHM